MADWNPEANDVFLKALEIWPADERRAFLDDKCGRESGLRAQVESLLAASAGAGSFLESQVAGLVATIDEPGITERPGTVIGPYKLLEQIGEGGFGVVFMAEQQAPIRRKVALKVLKPGMDTRQVVARFEAERQALALMEHPNIARVIDGGKTAGARPYFVMELVRGTPITEFCDQNHLSVRERLELFVDVCQAVQHAHQKGIIHRDLKPTNVMVAMHDDKPAVKVIDFGIAKAVGQQLTGKTLFTNFAQLIGTPLYMSPEQAGQSSLDADTRSDIYSLGVLLYELLTGTTPFDQERLRTVGYDEIRRIIREEEPPRPSTRMTTLGQAASTASVSRKSDPKRLSQLFRGELDWIVMKCLEKDRNRRYDTANSLARDIERYLHDEPVQACPPSAAYRLRKFVRRNRTAVAAAVSAIGLLLLAVLGLTISNLRIAQKKAEADANFRKACQAVDDQFTLVSQSKLFDAPGLQVLRKDLLESALMYYQDFLQQRPEDPVLQVEVAAAYFRLYEIYEAIDSGMSADAIVALEKGVEIVEKLLREYHPDAELYRGLAGFRRGSRFVHTVYSPRGPRADPLVALPLFERAARIWENFVRANPNEIGFQIDLSAFYFASHEMQTAEGQHAEALVYCRKAHEIRERLAHEYPNVPEYRAELAWTHDRLGDLLQVKDLRSEDVKMHRRRSLELREQLVKECPPVTEYQQALAVSYHGLGDCFTNTMRLPEAEQAYRQALLLQEKLATEFPKLPGFRGDLAAYHESLGHLFRHTGRFQEAEEAYRRARAIWEKLASDFPDSAGYREKLAWSSFNLCLLLAATGRPQEVEMAYRKVLEFTPDNPADPHNLMAWVLVTCPDPKYRNPGRALELAKKAVALAPKDGNSWNTLGVAQYRAGNWRNAVMTLEKSMEFRKGGDSSDWFFLAMAHWQQGKKEQARKWYDQAVPWMERNQPENEELRRFRAEAAKLLGIKVQPKAQVNSP